MSKTIKITVICPQCSSKLAVPITESDLGSKKQSVCPKCGKRFIVPISMSFASKFDSDPTRIGGDSGEDISLLLEVVPNNITGFQSFELTSDYYTIGRANNSGPEHRPDVEVITTDMKMSRKHAVIKKKSNIGFTITDLGSKNGIVLNGKKLDKDEEMYLADGDIFCIGDTKFKVSFTERMKGDELTR